MGGRGGQRYGEQYLGHTCNHAKVSVEILLPTPGYMTKLSRYQNTCLDSHTVGGFLTISLLEGFICTITTNSEAEGLD